MSILLSFSEHNSGPTLTFMCTCVLGFIMGLVVSLWIELVILGSKQGSDGGLRIKIHICMFPWPMMVLWLDDLVFVNQAALGAYCNWLSSNSLFCPFHVLLKLTFKIWILFLWFEIKPTACAVFGFFIFTELLRISWKLTLTPTCAISKLFIFNDWVIRSYYPCTIYGVVRLLFKEFYLQVTPLELRPSYSTVSYNFGVQYSSGKKDRRAFNDITGSLTFISHWLSKGKF